MTLAGAFFDTTSTTTANHEEREPQPWANALVELANLSFDVLVGTSYRLAVPEGRSAVRENLWTTSGAPLNAVTQAPSPTATALTEIKRITGLTWAQLAQLIGVNRRSVHSWAIGAHPSAKREEELYRLLGIARELNRGTPELTRQALSEAAAPDRSDEVRPLRRLGVSADALTRGMTGPHPLDKIAKPE